MVAGLKRRVAVMGDRGGMFYLREESGGCGKKSKPGQGILYEGWVKPTTWIDEGDILTGSPLECIVEAADSRLFRCAWEERQLGLTIESTVKTFDQFRVNQRDNKLKAGVRLLKEVQY